MTQEVTINQSTDYLKFQKIDGNRKLSDSHVKSLVESIKSKNLLHLRPIIIDENFYVLDGQHRLEAAKLCEVPIYYITCNSEKFKEITKLNQNQKNWKLTDFLNFYAINFKNPCYIDILNLMKDRNLVLEAIFIYMDYNIKKKELREQFCNGEFIIERPIEETIEKICDWETFFNFMQEKNSDYLDFFKSLHFRKALLEILESKRISRQQFWDRIKMNVASVYRCRNKDETLDMLLKIYNKQSPYVVKKEELNL